MITNISIKNTATFNTASLEDLQQLNFVFGANGTGKTTISRIIADSSLHAHSSISWDNQIVLDTFVYNQDFIRNNFSQDTIKGIFTLGQEQSETKQKIEETKKKMEELDKAIQQLTESHKGKTTELKENEEKYRDKFWEQKQKHDSKLGNGMEGFRSNKEKFMQKILSEKDSSETLLAQSELEKKAGEIFSENLVELPTIIAIQFDKLAELETGTILSKVIIGKANVDIAAMISKLQNSDWVRQGTAFYKQNDGICPFCQQKAPDNLTQWLEDYFDESYSQDMAAVDNFIAVYSNVIQSVLQSIQTLIDTPYKFLDTDKLQETKNTLESKFSANKQLLVQKKKEASQAIQLESVADILKAVNTDIATANKNIGKHNETVRNIKTERETLTRQIWRFIVEELKSDIKDYYEQKANIEKAIKNIDGKIKEKNIKKESMKEELQDLQKKITSVIPTLNTINKFLTDFGFQSFKLAEGSDGGTYKLIRQNGEDASTTLSEGERNFITFLYFYYLLKGSQSESEIVSPRIIVFDDPVSSLDNEVLFIVSNLIRSLFAELNNDKNNIKQIFVLTHNVYFYKEITFESHRDKLPQHSFWIVKKDDNQSKIDSYNKNPIKSSYQWLWEVVRDSSSDSAHLQNTMRRILETYFKLTGNFSWDNLIDKFEGNDKIICRSLIRFMHDGSHNASFDDMDYSLQGDTEAYKRIFQKIFEHNYQIEHYNMMMQPNQSQRSDNRAAL